MTLVPTCSVSTKTNVYLIMRKFKSLVLAVIGLLCSVSVSAEDFEVDGIYYNIKSSSDMTVEVTYRGDYDYTYWDEYSGAVTIPESVTYNGSIYSVTSIGSYAFYDCPGLTSIEIGNCVTSIGSSAFYKCSGLTSVVIPNSVTSIGVSAFYYCEGLTSVVIPNSVTSIGDYAFSGCSGLTSIEIPNSVTSIKDCAFYGCSGLTSLVVASDNPVYDSREGCNAIVKTSSNELVVGCKSTIIPNGVTSIGACAFYGCSGLTSVEIPNSVTCIGISAFNDTPLRSIVSKSNSPATLDVESSKFSVFSNYTYIHAPLYVPEGAYWNYAYAYGWGDFIHIKEMAMTEGALLSNKAYMIADSKGTNFKVYDAERDALKNVEYTYALDEESKDCCWTVMKENGKTYLFNLGAKKFGVVGDNGAISLSETPVHVVISETEGGLSINGNNCMFVLNKHVEVDATGISDVLLNGQDAKNAQIHSLDGRRQQTLKRGVNIVNGKKVFVQ